MKRSAKSRVRPGQGGTRAVVLGLCLSVLIAPLASAAEESETELLMKLLREAAKSDQFDADELRSSLAGFSSDMVPILFAVMDTGIVPDGETAVVMPDALRGSLWGAFSQFDTAPIRNHVSRFADAKFGERTRLHALKLLGAVGSSNDLALLGQLAVPEGVQPTDAVRIPFGYAVASIFERDPSAIQDVRKLYSDCHGSLRPKLLECISRANSPEKLSVLSGLLRLAPRADSYVLRTIGGLAGSGRGTSDEYVCGSVRMFLIDQEPLLVQAAAQTLGALRDEGAIEPLIELLREGVPQLAPVALQALIQITGRNFGTASDAWRAWFDEEQRWWSVEASRIFRDLRDANPGRVAAAIQAVSTHSLNREELATAVLGVLAREEPSLRMLACITLGNLGAEGARPRIQELLEDPDPDVRAAAKAAVSRLTFRILPHH